jgi:hypothetical protein
VETCSFYPICYPQLGDNINPIREQVKSLDEKCDLDPTIQGRDLLDSSACITYTLGYLEPTE